QNASINNMHLMEVSNFGVSWHVQSHAMTTILETRQLTKKFRSGDAELTVLNDVSLQFQAGSSTAIVGPSGSGKSTLLALCAGLADRSWHYPAPLSGREQQRVALARGFINAPKILFADEPTGNLDTETSHKIVEALFALNAENGTTLILVTHDLEIATRAQRVIRLRAGRVQED